MTIYRKAPTAQLAALREAVDRWSPRAYDDGVSPVLKIRVRRESHARALFLAARILDVALPYHQVANPTPVLVFQLHGSTQPQFLPATDVHSVIGPENDAKVIQ